MTNVSWQNAPVSGFKNWLFVL